MKRKLSSGRQKTNVEKTTSIVGNDDLIGPPPGMTVKPSTRRHRKKGLIEDEDEGIEFVSIEEDTKRIRKLGYIDD